MITRMYRPHHLNWKQTREMGASPIPAYRESRNSRRSAAKVLKLREAPVVS